MIYTRRLFLALVLALAGMNMASLPAFADVAEKFKASQKDSTKSIDHSAWDKLLKTYLRKGKDDLNEVDYKAFRKSGYETLKSYLQMLQAVDVPSLNRAEQFAFWVNLYNAKTVEVILGRYPVSSIKNIWSGILSPGPWKLKNMVVNGQALTLDDVEHVILRGLWGDPRIHYAVNCAAIGCPNLAMDAFTSANTQKLLEEGARAYVNSPRGVTLSGGRIKASKIYKWFIVDFGGNERGVLKHLRRYAAPGLAAKLKPARSIYSFYYDWSLNDRR